MLLFLGKAVAQYDRVVYRKSELKYERNCVRYKGDGFKNEICAELKDGGRNEGYHKYRNFGVAAGGKQQQSGDDDDHQDADIYHVIYYVLGQIHADLGIDLRIAGTRHELPERGEGLGAYLVVHPAGKCDVKQGAAVFVMMLGIVKGHGFYPVCRLNILRETSGVVKGNIPHHDLRRCVGDKLALHGGKTLTGLSILRQKTVQVVLDNRQGGGIDRQKRRREKNYHYQLSAVNNELCDLMHYELQKGIYMGCSTVYQCILLYYNIRDTSREICQFIIKSA